MEKVHVGPFKTVCLLVNFLAIYRVIQVYLYDFRTAIGPSMVPTIREGIL